MLKTFLNQKALRWAVWIGAFFYLGLGGLLAETNSIGQKISEGEEDIPWGGDYFHSEDMGNFQVKFARDGHVEVLVKNRPLLATQSSAFIFSPLTEEGVVFRDTALKAFDCKLSKKEGEVIFRFGANLKDDEGEKAGKKRFNSDAILKVMDTITVSKGGEIKIVRNLIHLQDLKFGSVQYIVKMPREILSDKGYRYLNDLGETKIGIMPALDKDEKISTSEKKRQEMIGFASSLSLVVFKIGLGSNCRLLDAKREIWVDVYDRDIPYDRQKGTLVKQGTKTGLDFTITLAVGEHNE